MNKISFKVQEDMVGVILQKILINKKGFSKNIIKRLKQTNGIIINGVVSPANTLLKKGDYVELIIPDTSSNIKPEYMPIDIIYEDKSLLIINKPANMVVHPTFNHYSGTLANGVAHYLKSQGLDIKIRFANRLDRDTSGIIIFTKDQLSHFKLSKQFADQSVSREYIAITKGIFTPKKGRINAPIARKPGSIMEREISELGSPAITDYETIEVSNEYSLIKLTPKTGRTHQLRVHCSFMGCPILGDTLYSNLQTDNISRQALHSYKIAFNRPSDGKYCEYYAPIADDIKHLSRLLNITIDFC